MTPRKPDRSVRSDQADGTHSVDRSSLHRMLRPSGGYRNLRSFQVSEIIYDATVAFCNRFISPRSRTHDQMVQAARSGRQNIAEGSRASGTSSQTEIRLVGVARASLEELLLDYEDFLRQRRLPLWGKDHPQSRRIRAMGRQPQHQTDRSDQINPSDNLPRSDSRPATRYDPYRELVEKGTPETSANTIICLIHQANYLLDRQLQSLERDFIQAGGYSEQLAAARRKHRVTNPADQSNAPACPKCGHPMVLRTARNGPRAGSQFWGCQNYPDCRGTLPKE